MERSLPVPYPDKDYGMYRYEDLKRKLLMNM